MTEQPMKPWRIEHELIGEPLPIGDRTLRTVARLTGWAGGQNGPQGGGGGGWLQVRPVEVIVRDADGAESRVPIVNPAAQALRGIIQAGLVVAGICAVIISLRKLMTHVR